MVKVYLAAEKTPQLRIAGALLNSYKLEAGAWTIQPSRSPMETAWEVYTMLPVSQTLDQ